MFKVMVGGEGCQPCSRLWEGVRGVSHVHGDGRGLRGVSNVKVMGGG